jgi:hypothetical protein
MPNHCTNHLHINAEPDTLEEIREALRDRQREEEDLTFRGICDRPDALQNIHVGSRTIDGESYRRWRETDEGVVPLTDAETKKLRREHGGADLIEWSRQHWGTKWDGYWSTKTEDTRQRLSYTFTTAWSPPDQFINKLRAEFPEARITLEYEEPNMGLEGTV